MEASTGTYAGGVAVSGPTPASLRFQSPAGGTYLSVVPTVEPISPEGETLVNSIRAMDAPFEVLVTGGSAGLVDTKASLFGSLPFAIGIIGLDHVRRSCS